MARRKRSYSTKGRSVIGVFLNNAVVENQKRMRELERRKAAEQKRTAKAEAEDERRLEKENELALRMKARKIKQQEKLQKDNELCQIKKKKAKEKLDAKVEKIYVRLESDIKKMGLYPGDNFIRSTAKKAEKLSVSAAQVTSYFIDESNLKKICKSCAVDFLKSKGFGPDYGHHKAYVDLLNFVTDFNPQTDAPKTSQYRNIKKELDSEIKNHKQALLRKDEREKLIEEIDKSKQMFKADMYDFWQRIEENDWGRKEAIDSDEYQINIEAKSDYTYEIMTQIRPIKLQKSG